MKRVFSVVAFRAILMLLLSVSFTKGNTQTHVPKNVNISANCKGFYEYLPIGYSSSSTNFPLLIYCGGAGTLGSGTTSQLSKLLAEGPPYYINNNQFPTSFTVNNQTSSFIIISPQFINWPVPQDVEDVLNYVLAQNYKVDKARIYLAGFSAGGDVTWKYPNTSLERSKKIAALLPVAGYNYPYVDTGAKYIAQANLPVWALHSSADQTAPSYWSQNFVNKINSYNPPTPAKITIFTGVAHDPTKLYVYNPTYRVAGQSVYEWLLSNRRNFPPIVNAGSDFSLTLPNNSGTLNGMGSDPDGGSLLFSWSKASGPSKFTFGNSNSNTTTISNLVAGVYNFVLKATDAFGDATTDTVKLTVINPFGNQLPLANAGTDQSITLPINSVMLNGSSSNDPNGSIESYLWTKISGPSGSILSNASSITTSVTSLKAGIHLFKLTVTDNEGGVNSDTVAITVVNPFRNIAPASIAGDDQSVTLPTNSIVVDGSGSSDSDGTILSYLWSQVTGPSSSTIVNPSLPTTSITNLQAGLYRFELKVVDDSSAIGRDTLELIVLPAPTINNRYVKVNLYGGTSPYNQDGWNNWNVTGTNNITSSNFNYSDGNPSLINALLSYSQGIADNGTSFGGMMCPPQVLRHSTYSTASTRTVTIKGLNNFYKYDIEFYSGRANTGNTTTFVINGVSKAVVTDNNISQKAVFSDIVPSNGQIVISLNKTGTYTYLNGFTLIEKSLTQTTNLPPVANAGNNVTITLPTSQVQLNASGSSDPDGTISSYSWTKIAGPSSYSIASPTSAITNVTSLSAGTYNFQLAVTDNNGSISKDTMQVIVIDQTDVINCSTPFKIVILGSSTAYGTGATPIDSSWANKFTAYARGKNIQTTVINLATLSLTTYEVLCPTGFIPPANRPSPDTNRNITKALRFNPDAIIINLPTNDIALGYTQQESKDNYERALSLINAANIPVWVTTTQPRNTLSPAERGYLVEFRDWTYQRFGSKTIDFWTNVANSDGTINEFYSAGDGVHVNNNGHQLFFTKVVEKRILDSLCLRKSLNQSPVSNAGTDVVITLPVNSTQLNGLASSDPDGTIASYLWSKTSGPAQYSISSASAANPTISNLVAGTYNFQLQVTDNNGATATDIVVITVNQSPVSNAGADVAITLPVNSTQLNGSASSDPDGTIAAYQWSKTSGPAQYSISALSIANPTISNLVAGTYNFQLQVTDNNGATATDIVIITVNPATPVNQSPVSNAGSDVVITLPVNSTQLNGSASSDPDGTIASYLWSKTSGPAQYSISSTSAVNPTISNLVAGTYNFQLQVTDNNGATATDIVIITVNPAANQSPVANAGADQSITLPASSVSLSGSASSDPDGSVVAYLWTIVSTPAGAPAPVIGTSTSVNTSVSNLVQQGSYRFQLQVTDNSGATNTDQVDITVLPQPASGATKFIKVNVYGGTNPYNSAGWFNWSVPTGEASNITSSNFNYDDNTASSISAVLNFTQGVSDNGATYGGTMCPPQVLRYGSFGTGNRTLTIRGLNNALKYDLEFYASRGNTGNSTQFTINGVTVTVNTSNNLATKAAFTDISPVNGQIVIAIVKVGTYNYLNGFMITEK